MRGRVLVLVLEHHRDLREVLVEALLDEEYMVTPAATAESAELALRTAADGQLPDVLVTDASSGRDLIDRLRADPRTSPVAVVTLSFRFDPPSAADVDLRRPFRLDQFLGAIEAARERHGPRPTHAPDTLR
jgi:CheY-like chemotaxis protein